MHMKTNKGYSDVTDFLGITLVDLATYLKVSRQFMSQVARQQTGAVATFRRMPSEILLHQINNTPKPDL